MAGAAGLGQLCRAQDEPRACGRERARVLVVQPVDERLDDEQEVVSGAVGDRRADDAAVLTVGVLAIGPQPYEQLGRGAAEAAHSAGSHIGEELRPPQAVCGADGAAALERDDQAGAGGEGACIDRGGQPDLRIEQQRGRVRRQGADEIELHVEERRVVGGKPGVITGGPELRALVGRDDGEASARGGELIERAAFGSREHS